MIVLDACILVAHLDAEDAHHDRPHKLLVELAGQPKQINVVNMAEVMVAPARARRRRAAQDILDRLNIDVAALRADAAGDLAELHATTGLKMPDCCALLTAEQSTADLASFDDRLRRAARARGVRVVPEQL